VLNSRGKVANERAEGVRKAAVFLFVQYSSVVKWGQSSKVDFNMTKMKFWDHFTIIIDPTLQYKSGLRILIWVRERIEVVINARFWLVPPYAWARDHFRDLPDVQRRFWGHFAQWIGAPLLCKSGLRFLIWHQEGPFPKPVVIKSYTLYGAECLISTMVPRYVYLDIKETNNW
jgi:hypothetical protein